MNEADFGGPGAAARGLLAPGGVITLLALWALFHFLLRVFLIPTLGVDHVEQAVAAQGWLLSYSPSQPPLYSWMQYASNRLLGASTLAFIVPKYLMVLAFLTLYYAFARGSGLRNLYAALAVFSLALLYQVGWKIHFGMTHTLLMSLAIALTMLALVRVRRRGAGQDYVLLGVGMGVGVMAKYGFALFLLALGLTLIFDRTRPAKGPWRPINGRRLLLALAVALLICGPLIWFGLSSFDALATVYRGAMVQSDTGVAAAAGTAWISGRLEGLVSLAVATLGFLSPLWLILVLCYPRVLPGLGGVGASSEEPPMAARWRGFLARFFLIMALLLVLMVLVGGATRFKERWMHPFLLLAPVALMHRVQRVYPASTLKDSPRHRVMLGTVGFFVLFVAGYRIAEVQIGPPLCGKCRHLVPWDTLSEALTPELGPAGRAGSVLAIDEHIAGNLLIRFPDRPVFVPRYAAWSPSAFNMTLGAPCVVVWSGESRDMPTELHHDLAARFATRLTSPPLVHEVSVPLESWRARYPGWAPGSSSAHAFVWHWAEVPGCGVVR